MAANYYHMTTERNDIENKKLGNEMHECKLELIKNIKKIIYSAVFGTIFMYLLFKMEGGLSRTINKSVIVEVIKVGGWMFIWQAFQTLAFDLPDKIKRINAFRK